MKREDVVKIFEGATDEQVNGILDINSADIGSAKRKLETERDNYKIQLETAQTALSEFEGVDVKDLQGKISALTADLAAKETDYQNKIADMEFSGGIDEALRAAGARNIKAAKALLDLEALKASKNRDADIKGAIEASKTENGYMYGANEPINNAVQDTGVLPDGKMSLSEAMKHKNEHPDVDISKLI